MSSVSTNVLAPSSAWTLAWEDGLLIASAGADAAYALDDVSPGAAAEVVDAWRAGTIALGRLSPAAAAVVAELASAGVVEAGRPSATAEVDVTTSGDEVVGLVAELNRRRIAARPGADGGDREVVTVVVRTNSRLAALAEVAPPGPHLLLDLAYAHTISVGPLVLPGETACLSCLAGRIAQYWGDPAPPRAPRATSLASLAAPLVHRELERIAAGDYSLANTTFVLDVDSRRATTHAVYRLPWCPVCGDDDRRPVGAIALPWADA